MERGESTRATQSMHFSRLAPWMCAGLVAGVEFWQKPPVIAVFVLAFAVVILLFVLVGFDLWQPPATRHGTRRGIDLEDASPARAGVARPSPSD